jgi:hypothetical protein
MQQSALGEKAIIVPRLALMDLNSFFLFDRWFLVWLDGYGFFGLISCRLRRLVFLIQF